MDELTIPEDWEEALEEDGLTDENEQDLRELLSEDAVAELTAPAFLHTAKTPTQYVSAEEKRVDTRESGITLIAVGLIVAVIDVIYYFSSFSNLYAAIVMGVMALAMICYGVHSLLKSNELIAVAAAEEQTKEEIHGFLADALSKERILEAVPDDSADGPELDLLRQQYCLDRVKEHFPNVDEALLLYLSDEWYNDLFESDSEVPEDTDSI